MIGADLALAALIDRAAQTYTYSAPPYITYKEYTHVEAPGSGYQPKDINRAVSVRVADNFAVMQDLPNGGVSTGPAFPVIPFFDPFSSFQFSYFANLKRTDIKFDPGMPYYFKLPADDPSVDIVVPYISEFAPRYAPDSTQDAPHFLIDPTSKTGNSFYPIDVREDPVTHLPAHVAMKVNGDDMTIALDFGMVQGHWVITHGAWSHTEHVFIGSFKVSATISYTDYTFPTVAPDARLAGSPSPRPTATASP